MPDPISQDKLDREIRYAMALGIVKRARSKGVSEGRYRRYVVDTFDGTRYTWTPSQVMAFAAGVRLTTQRKGS